MRTIVIVPLVIFLLFIFIRTDTASSHELLGFVKQALQYSDTAYDIKDNDVLSDLLVQTEEHQFDYKLIPLTTIGFADDTGSQTLGLEVTRKLTFGTEIRAGIRSDRTDLDTGYTVENSNTARAYIKISQGLFRRWGKKYNEAPLTIAKLKNEKQRLINDRLRQDLILRTATEYYQLVLARELITLAEKALARSREHLEAATSRHSVDLVSKVDVYRAEIATLNAENNVQEKRFAFQRAQNNFRQTLGMNDDKPLHLSDPVRMLVPVVPENWEEVLPDNRLEWQAYRISKRYKNLSRYRAEEALQPDIQLNLGFEQQGQGNSFEEAASLDETRWSIQFELRSSLDTFNEKNALAREQISIQKLKRHGASLRRRIIREAREALENLQSQERYYQINNKRLKQAESALDLTKIRYERGLSDNLDLLDAENAYASAEFDISSGLIAYNIAALKLAHAMGVLNLEWLELSQKNSALMNSPDSSLSVTN
ncbi:MAG: hypothetical protein CR981_02765 [Proteobacteria bacterium]|nr:MAG: hypothetical protein CR981_02765 [Pseudomonadota bacterium]